MTKLEELQQWLLYTPIGRDVLRNERTFYHHLVHNIFGYYSIQIGLPQINFLQGNKIPNHYVLGNDILCDLRFLPFASNSVDLIVCPHVLGLTNSYHNLLQECYRILTPEGKLIITEFNKSSLFNLFGKKNPLLAQSRMVRLEKLQAQLETLNFLINGGKFFGYRPPIDNARTLSYFSWMDAVGNRWFPTLANSYGLVATKEVITPTPIKPYIPSNNFMPQLATPIGRTSICHKNL